MNDNDMISLNCGSPGGETIEGVKEMILEGTKAVLNDKTDVFRVFGYGADGGDNECKQKVADFLSSQYGTPVSRDSLLLTAGATQGVHFLLTTLMASCDKVFIEDPAYFLAVPMIRDDLAKTLIPVPRDSEGMMPDVMEDLVTSHKPRDWKRSESGPHYWASVYFVPNYNNPTGQSYSHARLHQLVALARKHDILLIADDLYQFLYHSEHTQKTPSLLQTFDAPSDPDYKDGHLVSNSSFSKLLAPGLRFGWMEGPLWMMDKLCNCHASMGGGSFNHYTSIVVSELIRTGAVHDNVNKIRKIYKARLESTAKVFRENLPEGCSFDQSQGGFYIWIALRPDTDATAFRDFAKAKYKVNFVPGSGFSVSGGYKNYARISISSLGESTLKEGAERFCRAYKEYLGS